MNFAVFYKYTGKAVTFIKTETDVVQSFMADYNMLDVNISKSVWKNRLAIAVGAKNLLNVTSVTSQASTSGVHSSGGTSSPVAYGRTLYLRLSFNFDTFTYHKKK
jgi:outer membrane receptor for ferrienterochelin and colicins